jgi:hypothetical protein
LEDITSCTVAVKMSWAADRQASVAEDSAYGLLGLFGVNMGLIYGEGASKAFTRLQQEIIKQGDDESILAWTGTLPPSHTYQLKCLTNNLARVWTRWEVFRRISQSVQQIQAFEVTSTAF